MTEEEYADWSWDKCETCERLSYETGYFNDDELPKKWLCIGRIIKEKNCLSLHEKHNEIRVCIHDDTREENIFSCDWTPWESIVVATLLNVSVANYLSESQPKKNSDEAVEA